jgi:predicted AAA+ superfamily ATPase
MTNHDDQPTDKIIAIIDEVQYASDPSNFLKYLYDTYSDQLKIIATGSSAFYIDRKFRDSLAGRKRLFIVRTLNFAEFLVFKGHTELKQELRLLRSQSQYISVHIKILMDLFEEYLLFGGYPAIVLENDRDGKIQMLKDIRTSYVKKDIDESGIKNKTALYRLMVLLAGQTGNLVNKNELAHSLGIDNKLVEQYLNLLQKCFHVELIRPFYSNLRKELTRMPKVYFYDSGLRNALLNRFGEFEYREDKGQLLENYIFQRLESLYDSENIHFWRTADRKEVDFVIEDSFSKRKAFEVKYQCDKIKKPAYKNFTREYPDIPLTFISHLESGDCLQVMKL